MSYIGPDATETEPVETENIGSLGSLILAELPECSDLIVQQQLAYALREFCRETDACVVESPILLRENPHGWGCAPFPAAPNGMVVGTVLEVRGLDGRNLGFSVEDGIVKRIVVRFGLCDNRAVVRFSVYPKAGGEVCPAWFKERYAEAITAGAMHHLLSMNRPWADQGRAAEYGAKYADAINDAAYRRGATEQGGPESAVPCGGLFM